MSKGEKIDSGTPMPLVAHVVAIDGVSVEVRWARGPRLGKADLIDLSTLINSFKLYRPLCKNRQLFSTVHVIEDGNAIAWGDGDNLEMSATALERLAEETMTADDFKAFVAEQNLTHSGIAALLGYGRRQIDSFLAGTRPIPRVVALACLALKARGLANGHSDRRQRAG